MSESISKRDENAAAAARADGNVLLIRLKSIGDVLFTLPAVRVVRENFPDAVMTFLVSKENAALLQGFSDVDEVLALDRGLYRRGNPKAIVAETISLVRRLRRSRTALAVDFQGYGETALLTWCTRAPERWGAVHQYPRGWAYTRPVRRPRPMHPAEWNLWLLQNCGLRSGPIFNRFALPTAAREEGCRLFAAQGLDPSRPALFIQPFTSSAQKNWPLENYLALAAYWKDRGRQVLFGGGPLERAALEPASRAGCPVFAGTPLLVTAALMDLSTLVIGGDTGLLHLAVAMDKRVVMIMGSTAPGSSHPFQHPDWGLTPAGSNQPVSSIGLDSVVQASLRALADLGVPGA